MHLVTFGCFDIRGMLNNVKECDLLWFVAERDPGQKRMPSLLVWQPARNSRSRQAMSSLTGPDKMCTDQAVFMMLISY